MFTSRSNIVTGLTLLFTYVSIAFCDKVIMVAELLQNCSRSNVECLYFILFKFNVCVTKKKKEKKNMENQ